MEKKETNKMEGTDDKKIIKKIFIRKCIIALLIIPLVVFLFFSSALKDRLIDIENNYDDKISNLSRNSAIKYCLYLYCDREKYNIELARFEGDETTDEKNFIICICENKNNPDDKFVGQITYTDEGNLGIYTGEEVYIKDE